MKQCMKDKLFRECGIQVFGKLYKSNRFEHHKHREPKLSSEQRKHPFRGVRHRKRPSYLKGSTKGKGTEVVSAPQAQPRLNPEDISSKDADRQDKHLLK